MGVKTASSIARRTLAFLGAGALVVCLAGCGGAKPPADTGVEGIVTIGPMCPVIQIGQPCPDKPYAAKLTVANPSGKIIARGSADADGRYRILLAPGDYLLEAKAADGGPFPAAASRPFSVRQGEWTTLNVILDSGIR